VVELRPARNERPRSAFEIRKKMLEERRSMRRDRARRLNYFRRFSLVRQREIPEAVINTINNLNRPADIFDHPIPIHRDKVLIMKRNAAERKSSFVLNSSEEEEFPQSFPCKRVRAHAYACEM